ncbi:2-isopropylmalate synthase [Candidatus Johnevansia muelleri]|uniref:2-isopropylmalate synthase n=1 Tax=Candidatus Johnevansia muelleri TaxID=1495769 RepID=A0A078KAU8_9GAMM|nr:2-isopropylmalate synthase [Candidatus Evansia muelleri]
MKTSIHFASSFKKYRSFPNVHINRTWPSNIINKAPIWASVDMRDGNQSLIDPMDVERKKRFFEMLVHIGFKQIEVGFPSASQIDFDFIRVLIEESMIPDNIIIQVLTPARASLIKRTFEAIKGVKKAIVHLYNATSPLFRNLVLKLDKQSCKNLAVHHTALIANLMKLHPETNWIFQYSPEHFTTTERDFSIDVCETVMDTFGATVDKPVIINLPATVEVSTPNIYADQIEWFCSHISERNRAIISLHPHNDRGTGIAAAELGIMAGADRIEGTLFGNGERTGNVDIVTIAMNLYTQGIDPELDFSNVKLIMREVEYCNQLPIHPRHPYVGELVFTAFSGTHQDAIKKGLDKRCNDINSENLWEVPYLPVDPIDLGRSYKAVIRVNSQSGKGGISYILEQDYGIILPRRLSIEFSKIVKEIADKTGKEITSEMIHTTFFEEYCRDIPYRLLLIKINNIGKIKISAIIKNYQNGKKYYLNGLGIEPVSVFTNALIKNNFDISVIDYKESYRGAESITFIEIREKSIDTYGVGFHTNTTISAIMAIISAINSNYIKFNFNKII